MTAQARESEMGLTFEKVWAMFYTEFNVKS
jgi:hypothetical protein